VSKSKLLDQIESERKLLEGTLAGLGEDEMTRPGANAEWSVKDVLAHIVAWERLLQRCLAQVQGGVAPELVPLDIEGQELDELNRRIYVENRDRPLDDVLGEFERSYEESVAAVGATAEEVLIVPGRVEALGGKPLWHVVAANTFEHYREHRQSLQAWLEGSAGEEFYPMQLFVQLSVRDVSASARWYAQALGFRSVYAMPGDSGTQAMNHLRLGRYQDLMLVAQPESESGVDRGRGVVIYLTLDGGVDELAARARAAGARVEGPAGTPWNTREVTVADPDGYVLTFSQVVDADRAFSDVMPPSVS